MSESSSSGPSRYHFLLEGKNITGNLTGMWMEVLICHIGEECMEDWYAYFPDFSGRGYGTNTSSIKSAITSVYQSEGGTYRLLLNVPVINSEMTKIISLPVASSTLVIYHESEKGRTHVPIILLIISMVPVSKSASSRYPTWLD